MAKSGIIFEMLTVFFFQAEDGIRDGRVTGVQTCALPICGGPRRHAQVPDHSHRAELREPGALGQGRSEERRVGKECRSWRSPAQSKKKHSRSAPPLR